MSLLKGNRVIIIGAGAAGLVTAKVLIDNSFQVVIYEQGQNVGGVWNYAESTAMYDSLRTNLPKEIMAFSIEDPFPDYGSEECEDHSFLTHREVQSYLENFAVKHALLEHVQFNHIVTSVRKPVDSHLWTVDTSHSGRTCSVQCDAVVVCNGHFSTPYTPQDTPGLEHFNGVCHHSSAYDRIKPSLAGKNVLVVGSNSSGTDMARELISIASAVYVSDRSSTCDVDAVFTDVAPNLHVLPGIQCIQEDGSVLFTNGVSCSVDVILWCTGYLFDCPFLHTAANTSSTKTTTTPNSTTNSTDTANTANTTNTTNTTPYNTTSDTSTTATTNTTNTTTTTTAYQPCPVELPQQHCVRPLYQQLFAIEDPSLVFVGLPFRVVPFPMFYYQAQYVAAIFTQRAQLPTKADQYAWLAAFEANLVHNGAYSTKYHFLGGPPQWEYCRFLAVKSGLISDVDMTSGGVGGASAKITSDTTNSTTIDTTTIVTNDSNVSPHTTHYYTPLQHEQYLHMMESIYEDNMEHRVLYPGAPDTYRERLYKVNRSDFSWTVQDRRI